jgi:RNA polymerase sigma-70 factor (ECF subfamily)
VAQDAFLAAFERIAEFRGEGTFAGWVKRIAARSYLRRLQKERRSWRAFADARLTSRLAAAGATPMAGSISTRRCKVLAAAERICVTMCFGAGLSHAGSREALNLPLGTVKSHVKRGLDKLRDATGAGRGVALEGRRGNG